MKKKLNALLFSAAFLLFSSVPLECYAESIAVKSADTDEKVIALTFDDGPHGVYTEEILDILAEYGIKATFFVVGENAESYPQIIEREVVEGHELGNHTYSHPMDFSSFDINETVEEIHRTEEALNSAAEYRPKLFRPPGGAWGETLSKALERYDYKLVLWSVDTKDWKRPSAEIIADEVLRSVKPGAIILFHDFVSLKSNTPDALRIIIPELIKEGYEFLTVSELLSRSG